MKLNPLFITLWQKNPTVICNKCIEREMKFRFSLAFHWEKKKYTIRRRKQFANLYVKCYLSIDSCFKLHVFVIPKCFVIIKCLNFPFNIIRFSREVS